MCARVCIITYIQPLTSMSRLTRTHMLILRAHEHILGPRWWSALPFTLISAKDVHSAYRDWLNSRVAVGKAPGRHLRLDEEGGGRSGAGGGGGRHSACTQIAATKSRSGKCEDGTVDTDSAGGALMAAAKSRAGVGAVAPLTRGSQADQIRPRGLVGRSQAMGKTMKDRVARSINTLSAYCGGKNRSAPPPTAVELLRCSSARTDPIPPHCT